MRAVSRRLAQIRLEAERAVRDDDWPAFLALVDRLEDEDPQWWPHLWAPCAAIATQRTGGNGIPFLDSAIDGGFRQPRVMPLADIFAGHSDWQRLCDRMSEPAPPPEYELTQWPTVDYGPPLVLDRLNGAEDETLRKLIPESQPSAWSTAQNLLRWATTRWEHANDHVENENALEVLDRVDGGERFACVEYSIVLSQALNAAKIPARRLSLMMPDSHVGVGRGHVVSEAWIDDLNRWVVLDGQNGAWWGTQEHPLGWSELHELHSQGAARPSMVLTERTIDASDQDDWWQYFDTATSSGLTWGSTMPPIFQGEPVTARLVAGPDAITHPDLSRLETGLADTEEGPAVTLRPVHPYAEGVAVADQTVEIDAPAPLSQIVKGSDLVEVRTQTPPMDGSRAGPCASPLLGASS